MYALFKDGKQVSKAYKHKQDIFRAAVAMSLIYWDKETDAIKYDCEIKEVKDEEHPKG